MLRGGDDAVGKYCTYLTVYSGGRLPPFYIGFSTIDKVRNGYHGSVRSKEYRYIWDEEIRQHPELFKTIVISVHDNRDDALAREISLQRKMNVIQNPLYINQAIGRLVDNRGRVFTPEHKAKLSTAKRGNAWSIGKPNPTRAALNRQQRGTKNPAHSARMKGRKYPEHSERLKQLYKNGWAPRAGKRNANIERLRLVRVGRRWISNGVLEKFASPAEALLDGWYYGRK